MKIYLIGFMGSGKSTIGKRLAAKLNFQFMDLDQVIENQEGLSVQEIFDTKGEAYFRQLETELLNSQKVENAVISLGGGTPCFGDNMNVINKTGISVFLDVPVPIMLSRLMSAKTKRPLLEPYIHDREKLKTFVEKLLDERIQYYEQANIRFEASNVKAEDLDKVVLEIKSYSQSQS